MADTKVNASNGKFGLGGSKDTDIEGLDPTQYDVFTTDKNLDAARSDFPTYDWFACFRVKDKQGNDVNVSYTVKFDRPVSGTLYYYTKPSGNRKGSVTRVDYDDTDDKNNKRRVKATLTVGDPPIGMK